MVVVNKKELAQKRNYFKFKLMGMVINPIPEILTEEENDLIVKLWEIRHKLIENFDNSSREMGLKVPEFRCWCGKEGKYEANEREKLLGCKKVCNKHYND